VNDERERLTMPGQGPTDEDLRHDAELTRQELAQTVATLGDKVNVRARAHEKAEALRERGDELVERLPDPVAERVRPVVSTATRRPMIPLMVLLALVLLIRRIRRHR
jgi:hypothetical protein